MAQVLVKGQNVPLTVARLRVTVETPGPADLSALLLTDSGRVRTDADFVFYNQPDGPGASCRPAAGGRPACVEVDLAAVPAEVGKVLVAVSVDGSAPALGAGPAPVAGIAGADGAVMATFVVTGLDTERAVIAWEIYRRAGAWKIRAVGQGYAGGLAELAAVCGVDVDEEPAPAMPVPATTASPVAAGTGAPAGQPPAPPAQPPTPSAQPPAPPAQPPTPSARPAAVPAQPARPWPTDRAKPPQPAPQAAGGLPPERLYQQVWSIFEDAARSTSALRSATEYAEQRRDDEVGRLLDDPRARNSPETAAARAAADRRHDELVARATADHRRDVAQLGTELRQLDGVLPPTMARWDSPVWRGWQPPTELAVALRVGELHLPEDPDLRIPLLFRLPLARPLWIDAAGTDRSTATALARSVIARLLAAHPAGRLSVSVADLAGGGAAVRGLRGDALAGPPATTPGELAELLDNLVSRVDLIQMAMRSGETALPPGLVDGGRRLLVLHDFPYGFDERSIAQIQYLINDGPDVGVNLLLVADPADSSTLGPLVSALWRSMSRLPAVPDDHVGDPWVGLSWTFTPDPVGSGTALDAVLDRLAGGR
ncbi:TerD family protein [Polymorphospora sp. NPDC050346]|uniref:TerD family protein n=1 Tax=Polymorphospora sp. NPDC050346 TaxID=3155780 RepID=UPI0034086DF7